MPTIQELYQLLLSQYGHQGWWPIFSRRGGGGHDERGYRLAPETPVLTGQDRYEILLGTILTQNTNWRNVEKALRNLFSEGVSTPSHITEIPTARLEELIRPSGYYKQKSRRLKEVTAALLPYLGTDHAAPAIPDREFLLGIRGVGPETADSILLYAYGVPVFIADLYTRRFMNRLAGKTKFSKYEDMRAFFEDSLSPDARVYAEFHALIVRHGKEHCSATPRCGGCPCGGFCPSRTGQA